MREASRHAKRHAKPRKFAVRLGAPIAAALTLAGVAVAVVALQGGSAAPRPVHFTTPVATSAGSSVTGNEGATAARQQVATLQARIFVRARKAAKRKHLAALAAAKAAKQAAQQKAAQPTPAADLLLPLDPAAVQQRLGRRALGPRGLHPQRRRGRQLRLGTRQRRRRLPVPDRYLGEVRRRGQRVRRRRGVLPGPDLRQRHRRRWRVELDGLRRVLTARAVSPSGVRGHEPSGIGPVRPLPAPGLNATARPVTRPGLVVPPPQPGSPARGGCALSRHGNPTTGLRGVLPQVQG